MGRVVKRIVLTGGPCAGKSSSIDLIKEYLKNKGFIVYVVNESATELINSGIKPFGENPIDMVKFQYIIFNYQLYKENLIEQVSNNFNEDKDIVIIYDRGLMDNKAYINPLEFSKLLVKYNITEDQVLNRYDLVIHLETAAKSVYYTKENNKARSEDRKKAIEMDEKNYKAWRLHNNLEYVSCYDNFVDKQKELLRIVDNNFSYNRVLRLKK